MENVDTPPPLLLGYRFLLTGGRIFSSPTKKHSAPIPYGRPRRPIPPQQRTPFPHLKGISLSTRELGSLRQPRPRTGSRFLLPPFLKSSIPQLVRDNDKGKAGSPVAPPPPPPPPPPPFPSQAARLDLPFGGRVFPPSPSAPPPFFLAKTMGGHRAEKERPSVIPSSGRGKTVRIPRLFPCGPFFFKTVPFPFQLVAEFRGSETPLECLWGLFAVCGGVEEGFFSKEKE